MQVARIVLGISLIPWGGSPGFEDEDDDEDENEAPRGAHGLPLPSSGQLQLHQGTLDFIHAVFQWHDALRFSLAETVQWVEGGRNLMVESGDGVPQLGLDRFGELGAFLIHP
jgi:hypothetical protein